MSSPQHTIFNFATHFSWENNWDYGSYSMSHTQTKKPDFQGSRLVLCYFGSTKKCYSCVITRGLITHLTNMYVYSMFVSASKDVLL